MSLSGTKTGSFQSIAVCGDINAQQQIPLGAPANPAGGVNAPAGMTGSNSKILSQSEGTVNVDDPSALLSVAGESTFYLAIFWLTGGGTILNACFDVQYTSVSAAGGVSTLTLAGGSSTPTGAKYWASSGSAPTGLPASSTAVTVAINQDITDGISIPAGSGTFNIQQLIATSTQPGLVEWLTTATGNQERLSAILSAGAFDAWPTLAAQAGTLPSGGAVNSGNATGAWTTATTVTVLRCYNLGSTLANIGTSSASAVMQAGALVA